MSEAEKTKDIPVRSEVPENYRWNLDELYESDEKWEADFKQIQKSVPDLLAFKDTLAQSPKRLADYFANSDQISETFERLIVYAFTRRDEDSTNSKYQGLFDRAQRLAVELNTATSFVEPEILQMPESRLKEYLESEELSLYRHRLDDIARMKPHTLSPAEEAVLAAAGELAQASSNVFSMFNDADLTFPTIKDENGEDVEVTHGRFIRLMESKDRRVREDAFKAVHQTYGKWRNTIGATMTANVRKDVFYAKIRRYDSSIHSAMHSDNIPVEVYTNLIDTVHSRIDALHRYVDLRKKILGVDELHMYDLYVPLVQESDFDIPYEQAMKMVIDSLSPLGEDYVNLVKKGFESRWVDVYENRGKRSGAYSISAYGVHPYVLMNYEPNLNNVFTLAHEFGHAIHSYLSNKTQPYTYADYTIFVAEVASTLNEHLLFHHLLQETNERDRRLYLINNYLDTIRGTVFRQVKFAEFEKLTHDQVEAGEALTADWMCNEYHRLVKEYYGNGIVADDEIAMEWARIPHFYRAFYVYKYATGFAAATALGQAILQEGQPAVDRYLDMLRSGGSDYSLNLLKKAGVDMATPEPILQVIDVFESLLDELEQLA